jgi:hypothetical protein
LNTQDKEFKNGKVGRGEEGEGGGRREECRKDNIQRQAAIYPIVTTEKVTALQIRALNI